MIKYLYLNINLQPKIIKIIKDMYSNKTELLINNYKKLGYVKKIKHNLFIFIKKINLIKSCRI